MVTSSLVCLGLLSLISTSALGAPARPAALAARYENLPTTDAQNKRFHGPIRPFPISPLPLSTDPLSGNIKTSQSIKPSPIPLAPGPVLLDHPTVALPINPKSHIPVDTNVLRERRSAEDNIDHTSNFQLLSTEEVDQIDSLPVTVEPPLPVDVLPIKILPRSGNSKAWQYSPSNSDDSAKANPSQDLSTPPSRVNHVASTRVPVGDIFRRKSRDLSASHADSDQEQHSSTDGEDTSLSDEVLKQSLLPPNEVQINDVVIHAPTHDIFRRWRQPGTADQDTAQDSSRVDSKLVIHQPTNTIYRREKPTSSSSAGADYGSKSTDGNSQDAADSKSSDTMSAQDVVIHHPVGDMHRRTASASPITTSVDKSSELELTHHWRHGPVVPPRTEEMENNVHGNVWENTEKRDARLIPPPEYFEEQVRPWTPVQSPRELSRRHFQDLDLNDQYKGPHHKLPGTQPVPLPIMRITTRGYGGDEAQSQNADGTSETGSDAQSDRASHHHKAAHENADSKDRRESIDEKPTVSKRHHNDEQPDVKIDIDDVGPFHLQPHESKNADSVYQRQYSAEMLSRRSAASQDDKPQVGAPDHHVPTLHGVAPVVIAKFSKTPILPRDPDETSTHSLPPNDNPPIQRRQTSKYRRNAIQLIHESMVRPVYPDEKPDHKHDRRDNYGSSATQLIPDSSVHKKPGHEKDHDHKHSRSLPRSHVADAGAINARGFSINPPSMKLHLPATPSPAAPSPAAPSPVAPSAAAAAAAPPVATLSSTNHASTPVGNIQLESATQHGRASVVVINPPATSRRGVEGNGNGDVEEDVKGDVRADANGKERKGDQSSSYGSDGDGDGDEAGILKGDSVGKRSIDGDGDAHLQAVQHWIDPVVFRTGCGGKCVGREWTG